MAAADAAAGWCCSCWFWRTTGWWRLAEFKPACKYSRVKHDGVEEVVRVDFGRCLLLAQPPPFLLLWAKCTSVARSLLCAVSHPTQHKRHTNSHTHSPAAQQCEQYDWTASSLRKRASKYGWRPSGEWPTRDAPSNELTGERSTWGGGAWDDASLVAPRSWTASATGTGPPPAWIWGGECLMVAYVKCVCTLVCFQWKCVDRVLLSYILREMHCLSALIFF